MESLRCPIIFEHLYRNYSIAIRKKIAGYVKDKDAIEDVLQDTFLKVWKKLPTYDPSRGSIFTWLNAIAISSSIDYLRRIGNTKLVDEGAAIMSNAIDAGSHPDRYLLRHELTELSSSLPPELYKVVIMIYFRGCTQDEAASIMRLPLGTVKSRVKRALQIMRNKYPRF